MLKKVLFFTVFLLSTESFAFCEPIISLIAKQNPTVKIQYEDINIITNESKADWTEYAKTLNAGKTLGYTKAIWANQFDIQFKQDSVNNCLIPQIKGKIGYDSIIIKLATQIKDSPKESIVLNHEKEHVTIYEENLPDYIQSLQQDLVSYFNGKKLSLNENEEKQAVILFLKEKVNTAYKESIKPKHLELDSPENYQQLAKEVGKIKG
jgi:hypothetical protein